LWQAFRPDKFEKTGVQVRDSEMVGQAQVGVPASGISPARHQRGVSNMRSINTAVKVVVALAACLPNWVMSAELPPVDTPLQVSGVTNNSPASASIPVAVTAASDTPAIVTGMGPAINTDQLGNYRGGTDIVSNDMQLRGMVAGNSASYVATGSNTIDGGAFANASGLPIVIQNSGANVLIQNATIVNVQMK
jgi:hypothetical protein